MEIGSYMNMNAVCVVTIGRAVGGGVRIRYMNLLNRPPSFLPLVWCVSCSECRLTSDCSDRRTCGKGQYVKALARLGAAMASPAVSPADGLQPALRLREKVGSQCSEAPRHCSLPPVSNAFPRFQHQRQKFCRA